VIRYLSEQDATALAPAPLEAVALAERALAALADGSVELPPKPSVHPRPGEFANAMPAYVADGDLLGLKWVAVYASNADRGVPTITGLILLCDATSGVPRAILGAAELTGLRTAAVSGACIRALAPAAGGHLAIVGAGVEARTHLAVAAALGLREARVHVRSSARADALRGFAGSHAPEIALTCVSSAAAAVEGAAIVVTALPIGAEGARIPPALVRSDALVLPLDYATCIGADLANDAALYADDAAQFARFRESGAFPGYREPDGATGAALREPRPAGRVVCQNLGSGAVDLVFADAVVRAAEAAGVGTLLPR
jgi:ornithine cyclodeaminase/alanine dehydrogenase-like protein (mu-crystallin family)